MSQTKSHLTIGEVQKELSKEFPDISISRIRFLESEGLIDPERTPSGYRKFRDGDIARLKYILRLQRDHFMPLKIIRKRLEHYDPDAEGAAPAEPAATQSVQTFSPPAATVSAPQPMPTSAPAPSTQAPPTPLQPPAPPPPREEEEPIFLEGGLNLSFEQLVGSSGVEEDQIRELEEYGLLDAHQLDNGEIYYDEDDLMVAKIAKDFAKYGIGARHLRMYRTFAEKESGLFEQILVPMSRSGNDPKRNTTASINELAKLSRRLKQVQLRASLRNFLNN